MIPMTLAEIAGVVGGRIVDGEPDIVVTSAVADSREAVPGSLFVAIAGQRVDGHDFVDDARSRGAVVTLSERPVGSPAVVVADPVRALGALAGYVIQRLPDTLVFGITGSSGKTTTKDMLAAILAPHGETVAPRNSFNSEVGLPLTVLSCTTTTRYLVLEMGMRGRGHIAYLCEIAHPRITGLINVGSAHLELLGSREAIAEAKGEIIVGLPEDGVAVLHADNPLVMAQAPRTTARIMTFGEAADATVRATDVTIDPLARASYTVHAAGETARVELRMAGEHQVANALAATAMALAAGVSLADIASSLNAYEPVSKWRMEVHERPDGVIVVNDAYNANPESTRAALKALVAMGKGRRTWAVLGEMKEIGDTSVDEHDAIGRLAVRLDVQRLIAVGEGARPVHLGASHEGSWGNESTWVPDAESALSLLRAEIQPGDVVLVKASRSIGLDVVATGLLEDAP
ncbi:MAG: UDP-N-acetylmuramoyl-tripeptide--D-alanyl-D-alanine ligase [Actinomycetales bacterium mxb001]|nr:MAG: UDP-N-acetylmuramoyl-tripeptide--D-alanyl-D-alanine ligase [Actinomycetales bacterium mxb001]